MGDTVAGGGNHASEPSLWSAVKAASEAAKAAVAARERANAAEAAAEAVLAAAELGIDNRE